MENIYYLLFAFLICWYFIYLRKIAEAAKRHVQLYCQQNKLQFIDIARRKSRLSFTTKNGLFWSSTFDFHFSGDGEASYQGVMTLQGLKLQDITTPAFRIH